MANEITLTAALTCNKPSVMNAAIGMAVTALLRTMSGNAYVGPTSMAVPNSATIVPVGGITQLGYGVFENMDATNWIELQNGSGGAALCQLIPGDFAIIPLVPGATLYAISQASTPIMQYTIFSR